MFNPTRRGLLAGITAVLSSARGTSVSRQANAVANRSLSALKLRQLSAATQNHRPSASMLANNDESNIPNYAACFAKGLPQNQIAEADPPAYRSLLAAIESGKYVDFERIRKGGGRKLANPMGASAFTLEGGDSHRFQIPPAPSITSAEAAHETSELYWQALCRDIPFDQYPNSPLIRQAAEHLGVTPETIFRGPTKADGKGPYLSQFLLRPIPYGSSHMEQRYRAPLPNSDFMTSLGEWSQIQAGIPPWRAVSYDETSRYIRNGRDLAECFHYDYPYQAYLNAALIMFDSGPHSILNCNPFRSRNNPYRNSRIQEGFVTFGQVDATSILPLVTTAALKASWCQKWMVHRRLRPEALGGLIHQTRAGTRTYPVHPALLASPAVQAVFARTGTYLLPQSYPEGCPLHPSYPAGHACIAGACSVALKAFFHESLLLPGSVTASDDGLSLVPFPGYSPTIGDEIDKLAFNMTMGRDWAGIHYRSDCAAGLELGEDVAISVLQDLALTYTEDFPGFSFTRLNGAKVHISPQAEVITA